MKPPEFYQAKLYKQWQQSSYRVGRLLDRSAWPIDCTISKPSTAQVEQESAAVKRHIQAWQQVKVGRVIWQSITYRSLSEPISLPVSWVLTSPSEWVEAINNVDVGSEYALLNQVLLDAANIFHDILIRKRYLWRGKGIEEVVLCVELAKRLEPGAANAKPLRALAGLNVDTKFFERNEKLMVSLLDERFNGEVSKQGLSIFLNAKAEDDHWLLVVSLQDGLLPFKRCRLSTRDLVQYALPAQTIVIVENERCEHLLPALNNTIAILGAGLDLNWLSSRVFESKAVVYWGDIDTWGFQMLAAARKAKPDLKPMLMDQATFEQCKENSTVAEPVKAEHFDLTYLSQEEYRFFQTLQALEKGRLEQEFIPAHLVKEAINNLVPKFQKNLKDQTN